MADLMHLTLTTGHTRPSPRSEVSDDTIAALRPIVRAGGGELAGLVLRMEPAPIPGGRAWTIGVPGGPAPAVACWCCWSEQTHAAWWREMRRSVDPDLPGIELPSVPWLAVDLLPAVATLPREALGMLGDAERCIAWVLIEDARERGQVQP